MKIVISPAKSLDFETKLPTSRNTQPAFLKTAKKVNNKLQKLSREEISSLMGISENLANLNYLRFQDFKEEHTEQNSRPAIYAFAGDVYTGLDAYTIPTEKLDQLENKLRILSGFYGILKPLDLIQPYRLEMGTKISIDGRKNLYELWQEKITSFLNAEMQDDEILVNLASNEYFKAVNTKTLKTQVITPVFKDFKNGTYKTIAFYAKKARGAMVRYIIDENINDLENLKSFDIDGYRYSEALSKGKNRELIFTR